MDGETAPPAALTQGVMMPRKRFSSKERVRLFDLHGGKCHLCGEKVQVGEAWDLEHIVPWELTQDDSDDNVRPAHKSCHKAKTADDVRGIRKADRAKAKHIGAVKRGWWKPDGAKFNWQTGRYER